MHGAPMNKAERHSALCEAIAAHDYAYYVLDRPAINDEAYDALFRELKELEQAEPKLVTPASPTQRVGEQPRKGVEKANHALPMYSLDNTYNEADLRDFDRRVRDGLPSDANVCYVVEPKLDGASLEIVYQDGRLVKGITRGDGRVGEDVTLNVRTIRGLPLQIAEQRRLSLRGEVVIFRRDLEKVNKLRVQRGEEPFANPRNAAAGSLRLLNTQQTSERPLRLYIYELAENHFETHTQALNSLRDSALPSHGLQRTCASIDEVLQTVHAFDSERTTLPYDTDGMVIKVDSLSQRELLGTTARFPRWAIAYKFAAEQARTQVESISFDVGRSGALTPVANLKPVALSGTTVSRASLHNIDYVREKDVREGDFVWIQKAGEIIPQVLNVDMAARPSQLLPWAPPTTCPVCQSTVQREDGVAALRCQNPQCKGRIKASLIYFTRRGAMNIDHVGQVLVEQLIDHGLIHDAADIFDLPNRRAELLNLPRLGEKSVDNIIASIEASKTSRPLHHLLTALGIPLVGTVAANQIAEVYPDLPALLAPTPEEVHERLADLHGIGPKIADSMAKFLASPDKRALCDRLLARGVRSAVASVTQQVTGPLNGQSFCVTGVLSKPRKQIHAAIEAAGGTVHARVKQGTSYLVAGEKVGASKLSSAKKFGAEVVNETQLSALLPD